MNHNTTQKLEDVNKTQKTGSKPDFSGLVNQILSFLPERTRDIFKRRYGLAHEKGETLEKIGSDYGITRERVRQIVADAQKNISANLSETDFLQAENGLIFTIEKNNGIIKESVIVNQFNSDGIATANAIKFLAECSSRIKIAEEKGLLEKSWVASSQMEEKAKKVAQKAEEILKNEKKTYSAEKMSEELRKIFPEMSEQEIMNYLEVSVRVKKNKFGKWGIYNWPEISPKGTREKVYLILKEKKQPLHFAEIAKLIDEYKLGTKKAHPQTVHNELIKDDRFVLIGRGMYALAEWGYKEGTIKDVLQEIIEKSGHPLKREEILREVMKRRKVKKSTVLINLNNRGIFEKQKDHYSLKR
ncbi:MAG: HTH domain-containing protein [Parcubacteria group bacterium]|jgi:DNA-directed RNA polymerase delta subunit